MAKKLATRTKTKDLKGVTKNIARLKNVAKDLTSLPGWFRVINQTWKKGLTKTGVPKFELWKFSDFNSAAPWRATGNFLILLLLEE